MIIEGVVASRLAMKVDNSGMTTGREGLTQNRSQYVVSYCTKLHLILTIPPILTEACTHLLYNVTPSFDDLHCVVSRVLKGG